MIGVCDCNSFFASCEHLFRPDLANRPIVVLSNNDGVIVALDSRAKELGFKRGQAWFEAKAEAERAGIVPFSSNYTLYQDLSERVMRVLLSYCGTVDQYSIDEAFISLPISITIEELQKRVSRGIGIPVSIGFARTKTLAKIASKLAKGQRSSVFIIDERNEREVLSSFPIKDIWGIGRAWSSSLERLGIRTALRLRECDISFLEKRFPVTLIRTVMELNGEDAYVESSEHTSVMSGITFSSPIQDEETMIKYLAVQAETLSKKLEDKGLLASVLGINFFSSRFRDDYTSPYRTFRLSYPTSYAPTFIKIIRKATPFLFKEGVSYKGCRVFAFELSSSSSREFDFFQDNQRRLREDRLASVLGEIKVKYGDNAVRSGTTGFMSKADLMKREMKSPNYTTDFSSLPSVY